MLQEILLPEMFVSALESVQRALECEKSEFVEVRLFGSCAKGTYSASSDIDLLILTKNKLEDRAQRSYFREIIDNALHPYGLESDVVFYTVYEFENDKSAFTKSIQNSFVIIKGEESR